MEEMESDYGSNAQPSPFDKLGGSTKRCFAFNFQILTSPKDKVRIERFSRNCMLRFWYAFLVRLV